MSKLTFQWNSVPKLTLDADRLVSKLLRAEVTRAEPKPIAQKTWIPHDQLLFEFNVKTRNHLEILSDDLLLIRADPNLNILPFTPSFDNPAVHGNSVNT